MPLHVRNMRRPKSQYQRISISSQDPAGLEERTKKEDRKREDMARLRTREEEQRNQVSLQPGIACLESLICTPAITLRSDLCLVVVTNAKFNRRLPDTLTQLSLFLLHPLGRCSVRILAATKG